jgi:hypothetical protein
MCNLCSITTNQEAIRALFRVINRYVGNLRYQACFLTIRRPSCAMAQTAESCC